VVDTSISYSLLFVNGRVMDDWKLKTTPVVRLETPSKTYVHFICYLVLLVSIRDINEVILLEAEAKGPRPLTRAQDRGRGQTFDSKAENKANSVQKYHVQKY